MATNHKTQFDPNSAPSRHNSAASHQTTSDQAEFDQAASHHKCVGPDLNKSVGPDLDADGSAERPSLYLAAQVARPLEVLEAVAFSNRVMYMAAGCSLIASFGCGLIGGTAFYWLAAGFLVLALVFALAPAENRSFQKMIANICDEPAPLTLVVDACETIPSRAEPFTPAELHSLMSIEGARPAPAVVPFPRRRPDVCAVRTYRCATRPDANRSELTKTLASDLTKGDWR